MRYLQDHRCDQACLLLRDPALAIGGIAQRVGFASIQQLATALRRRQGMTPAAYRKRWRKWDLRRLNHPGVAPFKGD